MSRQASLSVRRHEYGLFRRIFRGAIVYQRADLHVEGGPAAVVDASLTRMAARRQSSFADDAKLQHLQLQHRVSTPDNHYIATANSALFTTLHENCNQQQCRKPTSSHRRLTYLPPQPSLSPKKHRSYSHTHPHPHYPGPSRFSSRAKLPNHGPFTKISSTPPSARPTRPPRAPFSSASKRASASTTSASSHFAESSMKLLHDQTRTWRRCLRATRRYSRKTRRI